MITARVTPDNATDGRLASRAGWQRLAKKGRSDHKLNMVHPLRRRSLVIRTSPARLACLASTTCC